MVSTGNWSPFLAGYNGTCTGFNGNCNGPCWSLLVIGHLLLLVINGTCTGFNGNCNGPCWSLLVIGHLLLLVIMGLVLVLMETVMDPVGLYW